MEDYEELLEEAYRKVKVVEKSSERFEVPKASIAVAGNRTIITNFLAIASKLRREPQHLAKFLMKELAAPAQVDNERLVLNRKIPAGRINQKIESYVKNYVICPMCGKPDTELIKQDRILFLHCLACGAKEPAKGKI